ncbi:MAG: vitamin B12-dependent ribonucleotide reductase [Nanoarchaeota archaeon]|nr:vitamin B12-dependent ribonucleotide reductase [Nanoarchaeota archaeon]
MAREKKGLTIDRYFTKSGKPATDYFEWERSNTDITDDNGAVSFVQEGAEFPKHWSGLARTIAASKYFFGKQGTSQRESSVRNLVGRVSSTMTRWGAKQKYFTSKEDADAFQNELAYLAYSQQMSFNSPVWFNVGTHLYTEPSNERKGSWRIADKNMTISYPTPFGDVQFNVKKGTAIPIQPGEDIFYPQTAACYIQYVGDTMEGIMELAGKEALLFKFGSGTGTNLSSLRSSREELSAGGKPSGPLAYWAFYDKVAGIVRSGGKTRRASKMDSLEVSHPDILEFIRSKKNEEKLMYILIDNGVPWEIAQQSVNYQNSNISIAASKAFLNAVRNDEEWQTVPVHCKDMADEMPKYRARKLMREIAEATHFCGDPGMQFLDTINKWHTCKKSGRIRASNPCSEYLFLDDTSCNLASQNLMSFRREDDSFDIPAFEHSIRITAIGQDLEVDNSSSPTQKIAENSHKYRALGLGYSNLGALLMSYGLPYDSDEARTIAASITALMTASVYKTSAEMAKNLGAFEEFENNREPMMEVMNMHREAIKEIQRDKLPKGLENILDTAIERWDEAIELGEKYGYRNAQATLLAPNGTIGFIMDCDTKGIEPEMGLVQRKKLVGGGTFKLVNTTVVKALARLDYTEAQINEINAHIIGNGYERVPYLGKEDVEEIKKQPDEQRGKKLTDILNQGHYTPKQKEEINFYINGYETMEGAPHIREEHMAIFDCANKPKHAKRTISTYGHLKMMAAVQPFLSGAISKTVNMPKEATVEEIEDAYIKAEEWGLKAVAIYRDQSKRVQPLSFSEGRLEDRVKPVRRKLPNTRKAIHHRFEIAGRDGMPGHEGYIGVGMYDDGTLGEAFIDMSKEGTTVKGLMDTIGILTSMALQYGVPVEALVKKFRHQKFEPYGLVKGHPDIHVADSSIDYIFHFIEKEFLKGKNGNEEGVKLEEPTILQIGETKPGKELVEEAGGFCTVCGAKMIKKGHCLEKCSNPECGWENTKGCGE